VRLTGMKTPELAGSRRRDSGDRVRAKGAHRVLFMANNMCAVCVSAEGLIADVGYANDFDVRTNIADTFIYSQVKCNMRRGS